MKKKNLNVVEEVNEVETPIEETGEEAVDKKTEVAKDEVEKEGMLKRAGKAVGGGIKKYGKKVLVGAGLVVTGIAVGAITAYKKYGSDGTEAADVDYNGDDGYEVDDLEPSDYTEETSYEESKDEE